MSCPDDQIFGEDIFWGPFDSEQDCQRWVSDPERSKELERKAWRRCVSHCDPCWAKPLPLSEMTQPGLMRRCYRWNDKYYGTVKGDYLCQCAEFVPEGTFKPEGEWDADVQEF